MSTADGGRFGRLQNLDEGTRRVGAGSAVTIVATVAAFLLFPAATIYPSSASSPSSPTDGGAIRKPPRRS
ncbi:hypothetical protein [Halarchaeum acidiphilum]|uniref:hypothetical protein n=1 Tax=Halarchaeum acidiphilum TaxID=489138 RepID=UPI00037F4B17|nr:hypothetical protein [Halarchaeum acidiphilum]